MDIDQPGDPRIVQASFDDLHGALTPGWHAQFRRLLEPVEPAGVHPENYSVR
jgi:hypothetical protein